MFEIITLSSFFICITLLIASFIIFVGALLSDAKIIKIDIAYNKRPYKQILKAFGISIIVLWIVYFVAFSIVD